MMFNFFLMYKPTEFSQGLKW